MVGLLDDIGIGLLKEYGKKAKKLNKFFASFYHGKYGACTQTGSTVSRKNKVKLG